MRKKNLEEKAEETLRSTDTDRVPVAIDMVAKRLNLTMQAATLAEDVSGLLFVQGDRGAIGYNSAHAHVRQRFTNSHEIAHYLLHAKRTEKEQLFIDRHVTFRRDEKSTTGEDREEVEANQFGAALLMPKDELGHHIDHAGVVIEDILDLLNRLLLELDLLRRREHFLPAGNQRSQLSSQHFGQLPQQVKRCMLAPCLDVDHGRPADPQALR
jgi:Zn-dependent peptidase ImmA (M78 family)